MTVADPRSFPRSRITRVGDLDCAWRGRAPGVERKGSARADSVHIKRFFMTVSDELAGRVKVIQKRSRGLLSRVRFEEELLNAASIDRVGNKFWWSRHPHLKGEMWGTRPDVYFGRTRRRL
jgi:hypothetical protein